MFLSIIAAADENNVIGMQNRLPWKLPADLKRFQELTKGHPVIMGRKTYESLPEDRKPLPNRTNIVITRDAGRQFPGCTVVRSLQDAIDAAQETGTDEAFVIGGGEIYAQALPIADRMYLTRVHGTFEGDALFPSITKEEWHEVSREEHPSDAHNPVGFTFFRYERQM